MHPILLTLGASKTTLIAPWSDIAIAFPASQASNEDYQISWTGGTGTRTVKNDWNNGGTLQYRLDAGAWQTYTQGGAGFSISSGQTLAWRLSLSSNQSPVTISVTVNGALLDQFQMSASGFP